MEGSSGEVGSLEREMGGEGAQTAAAAAQSHARGATAAAAGCRNPDPPHTGPAGSACAEAGGAGSCCP